MPRQPYRAPRDWLPQTTQRDFGVASVIRTHQPQTPLEEQLHRAALRQHRLGKKIRDTARDKRIDITAIAAAADVHPDTDRDILNGTTHATLASLTVLAHAVGLDLKVALTPEPDAPDEANAANPNPNTSPQK